MLAASISPSGQLNSKQLRSALAKFLPQKASTAEKIRAVEAALLSPLGQSMRENMAQWIVDELVPVERVVPPTYLKWRSPVRDAMIFVVARLSASRLAPKLVEQIELPLKTSPEERLLRLIAKVPGLQKLGQVIARNRHLRPSLRKALARLENGIRDVTAGEIRALVERKLGPRLQKYDVKLASTILSEASVSAVVRFTWQDPVTQKRRRGVFKVLKPHIPAYFAEDMDYLQGLAQHFGDQHHRYGFPASLIPDTFRKVRRLLQHEVNFRREQKTLLEAANLYVHLRDVRVPEVFPALCTRSITALSEEAGIKVPNAAALLDAAGRQRIVEQIIEALVAIPLLSGQENAVFHGDPHAGNLLYDARTGRLTIIDWALRERLSREQRRHLALLVFMVALRDSVGATEQILALSDNPPRSDSAKAHSVADVVSQFLDQLPIKYVAGAAEAMRLLEMIAVKGVRFPSPLVMLSKVIFTLDGLLADIGGNSGSVSFAVAREIAKHWFAHRNGFRSPLKTEDWVTLNCSALLFPTRSWVKYQQVLLDRYLPAGAATGVR
jgi:ubiquinone biosynthesis protein